MPSSSGANKPDRGRARRRGAARARRTVTHRFELHNDLSEMAKLAQELEAFGSLHGVPQEAIGRLNLALEELATNTISYGFPAGVRDRRVRVELRLRGSQLRTRVEDDGRPFDPLSVPPPDTEAPLQDRDAGGLGVLLVRELMDEVQYRRARAHNVVTLVQRLQK